MGHSIEPRHYSIAKLRGWRRGWNLYVSNNDKNVKRPFFSALTNQRSDSLHRTLDIILDKASYVNKIVHKVTAKDLNLLDDREDVYRRIDVTENLDIHIKDAVI